MSRVYEKKRWAERDRDKGQYVYKVKNGWKIGTRPERKKVSKRGVPIVYGDRICRQCKGICHDGSYRRKQSALSREYGARSGYYCSKQCLKNAYYLNLEKHMRQASKKYKHYIDMDDVVNKPYYKKAEKEFIARYERVDCITR